MSNPRIEWQGEAVPARNTVSPLFLVAEFLELQWPTQFTFHFILSSQQSIYSLFATRCNRVSWYSFEDRLNTFLDRTFIILYLLVAQIFITVILEISKTLGACWSKAPFTKDHQCYLAKWRWQAEHIIG